MEEKKDEVLAMPKSEGKRAWMFNWNPDPKDNLPAWNIEPACEDVQKGIQYEVEWGSYRSDFDPEIGDDVFLIKVGEEKKTKGIISHRGIVAHGRVTKHLGIVVVDKRKKKKVLVLLDWAQEEPDSQFYQKEWIPAYPKGNIKTQQGGWEIEEPTRSELMKAWNDAYSVKKATRPPKKLKNASDVTFDHNLILCGPPGTGKTYSTVIYAVDIIKEKSEDEIKADLQNENLRYDDFLKKYKILRDAGQIAFTTFHQSYGYEEFIEGIRPKLDSGTIQYERKDGIFKVFCEEAAKPENKEERFVFIIDEINRGNISKIFGELITLIEDSKRAGAAEAMEAVLPYSQKSFSVPQNVYIIGTMNTADRSIAMMDTALRRRFSFVEMMPDTSLLDFAVAGVNIKAMLDAINERITYLYDREHTIGHAFFMGLEKHQDIEHLSAIFKKKVIPLLQEYFYDDYEKIQLVLGDNAKKNELKFIQDTVKQPAGVFRKATAFDDYDEKTLFTINKDAFGNPESYQQIYKEPEAQKAATQSATAETTDAAKDDAE